VRSRALERVGAPDFVRNFTYLRQNIHENKIINGNCQIRSNGASPPRRQSELKRQYN
jgi:hypothetical protein